MAFMFMKSEFYFYSWRGRDLNEWETLRRRLTNLISFCLQGRLIRRMHVSIKDFIIRSRIRYTNKHLLLFACHDRSTGGHYNPDKLKHGAREDSVRHVGDLGNVAADENGAVSTSYSDNVITLFGSRSIIGRAVVLHAAEDDLGKTDHPDSHKTGNAGGRVACGIIGIL